MGCCGQGRAALRAASAPDANDGYAPAPAAPPPAFAGEPAAADPPGAPPGVRVRYTERARVRVRGPVSGRDYVFSGEAPVGAVDARDAERLLGTGYFRRAY